jgi:hypothetical protein
MPVSRPYFGLHQIITGLYTNGGEFILADGRDYVGPFHILPTGQRFSDFRPKPGSVELFERRIEATDDSLLYNSLTGRGAGKHVNPVTHNPQPTPQQYRTGKMERFFVQKRNSPLNTIVEINAEQYNQINKENRPGINGVLWNKIMILWRISTIPAEDAAVLNRRTLQETEDKFPGIGLYLSDILEFYKP